jgi:hypothetical protein
VERLGSIKMPGKKTGKKMIFIISSITVVILILLSIYLSIKLPGELGPIYPDDQFYKYLTEDKLKAMCSVNNKDGRHE